MNYSQYRQLFYSVINQPDEKIDLAKAALYLALEYEPEFDPDEYLNALDTMADEVREKLPETLYPLQIIKSINNYLYDDLGFAGNTIDYYDPQNSFLNQVIERHTGIPITLSLVYLEIAKRINFPMVGIGMPGHFLIRPDFEEAGIYVDAFDRGEILFPQDCQERLARIYGRAVELQPQFLAKVSKKQFLARMLTNLKGIYLNRNEGLKAIAAIDRILLLFPDAIVEKRDRGVLYYQLNFWAEARQDLESYLVNLPQAEDADIIRQLLASMSQDL
ncbi:MAG: tetratricopeptide repeat protein [Okeania sp. SIO2G4]|uniref:SirB1 family protein n=1 Tax=unclassified Okeania TaxID=2634635 RepID=UPI0013BD0591|nr:MULTISPECIES: transglutaminase-like domain-containing protein [unclassified Okeania]NEP38831.1 tetratricopeptide repeat protein [Okeania sp. SIO2H7]NEP71233.1 tetratricopeptide repeat protein [Okeania sp. SIO2G5]NEP92146.1 tetratricopeptide repeat protein [Okeania sp. SIO2F5]NEQ90902.1 tetratricopeptide repeat protein [Okeania sp. SIO2G4]